METLTIKSPADLLSFIGHTLGFWPQESLVCLTIDTNHIGATLRVDLPRHDGAERTYRWGVMSRAGKCLAMTEIPAMATTRASATTPPTIVRTIDRIKPEHFRGLVI